MSEVIHDENANFENDGDRVDLQIFAGIMYRNRATI
jgi:hypothetical protein